MIVQELRVKIGNCHLRSSVYDFVCCRLRVFVVGVFFGPEAMAGAADEDVFQAGLVDGDAFDLAGKCFDNIGDEAVSALDFQTHLMI